MNDQELRQIGSRHSVRDYLKRLEATWKRPIDAPDDWFRPMVEAYRTRMTPAVREAALARMADGPTSASLLRVEISKGRRLGKDFTNVVAMRAKPSRMVSCPQRNLEDRDEEVLVLWRDTYGMGMDRLDMIGCPSHLAFTRHALERIYEREGCMTGELDDKVKEQIVDADRNVAFAAATGLSMGSEEGVLRPGDTMLVPLADALLITEARCVAYLPTHPLTMRIVVKRGMVHPRSVDINANHAFNVSDSHGRQLPATFMHTARTYLTSEILRPEQREYRDLFLELAGDEGMAGLGEHFHQAQRPDRKARVELTFTDEEAEKLARMRELLPQCISADGNFHQVWSLQIKNPMYG